MTTLVFDLDGTISDPVVGIGRSLNHALATFGYPVLDESSVSRFVGPPLDETFRQLAPRASDDTISRLVGTYRARYAEVGYAENALYTGIPEALEHLAARGVAMGICTSKRQDFAERILDLFHLRSHFVFVCGGDVGVRKNEQLSELLGRGTIEPDAMMIGDRAVDVLAARANGLRSAGVLWGHGSREELARAAPDRLLEAPAALASLAHLPRRGLV